jgi:hypothetical protein
MGMNEYEDYGKTDSFYAVLSREDAKNNNSDIDEFIATGRSEIAEE